MKRDVVSCKMIHNNYVICDLALLYIHIYICPYIYICILSLLVLYDLIWHNAGEIINLYASVIIRAYIIYIDGLRVLLYVLGPSWPPNHLCLVPSACIPNSKT